MPTIELKPKPLYTREQISERIKQLAQEIADSYYEEFQSDPDNFRLVLIAILSGAEPFMSDLARELSVHFPLGVIEKEYISIESRFGMRQGEIKLLLDTKKSLEDAHVVVVEDIIDTGETLARYLPRLAARNILSKPQTCVLVDKTPEREKQVDVEFIGFRLDDNEWIIGYGLDFKGAGRELPDIMCMVQPDET